MIPDTITSSLPGVGGICRSRPEDFYVEEIPAYPPSGSGQHTLFEIEKTGIDTFGAIRTIAHALDIPNNRFGSAGLKDAQAVSRQHLSVEGVEPQRLLALQLPHVRILWAEKHHNRLKIGHLRGNHFATRIRQPAAGAYGRAADILQVLIARGLPNGFGAQRFGSRRTTHLLGRALLEEDLTTFFSIYLGNPQPGDTTEMRLAREAYAAGDLAGALQRWPYPSSDEFKALRVLAQHSLKTAYYSLPRELLRLTLGAYQAYLFNHLLQQRLATYDQLENGDLAYKHENGACFMVRDAVIEQPRAYRLEISPTAPLYGRKVRLAEDVPGERERALLTSEGISLASMHLRGFSLDGDRRPLRVPLSNVSVQEEEEALLIRFTLPSGAFATNVLREVMKTDEMG